MKRILMCLMALTMLSLITFGQTETPRVINGGVLNGKAVSLPKPVYPVEAREARAAGAVAVEILIDENGTVIYAVSQPNDQAVRKNEDGTPAEPHELHPALRTAAETAAMAARFAPTLLSGQPVKVRGRIIYNFVAGSIETSASEGVVGGVLNAKASSLPAPVYPPAAQAVRASGAVTVQVTIDEDGNVIAAHAVSGHPLLRSAAVAAAREAKFSPTSLNGEPVKITGVLTYSFTAGEDSAKASATDEKKPRLP